MTYNKDLARELCKELGIEWNEESTVPTLSGKPISEGDVDTLFHSPACCSVGTTFTLGISFYSTYGSVDLKCA